VGQTEFARPSCEDAEFVCCEKNGDDVYFLQFVRRAVLRNPLANFYWDRSHDKDVAERIPVK
jgi:hypothetical protein